MLNFEPVYGFRCPKCGGTVGWGATVSCIRCPWEPMVPDPEIQRAVCPSIAEAERTGDYGQYAWAYSTTWVFGRMYIQKCVEEYLDDRV